MAEGAPKQKVSETLHLTSLTALARHFAKDSDYLTLPMQLNFPSITLEQIKADKLNELEETDQVYQKLDSEEEKVDMLRRGVLEKCIMEWWEMTKDQKNKVRFNTLLTALKQMNVDDVVEKVSERFDNNLAITPRMFKGESS